MIDRVSCVVCGESEFREIAIARQYTGDQPIHICWNCGMVQVLARRTPEEIFKAWRFALPGGPVYRSAYPAVEARHSYVASFLQTLWWPDRPSPILDVGGGGKEKFVKKLRKWHSWVASEWNDMAEDLAYVSNQKFRTLTLNWVLENCGNPNAAVTACLNVLQPDGKIVVATGSRILTPFKKPLWAYLGPGQQDQHAFRFSVNTLRGLLARNGLKAASVNSYIDSDWLVIAAARGRETEACKDDPAAVIDYFERWHRDTEQFYPRKAA